MDVQGEFQGLRSITHPDFARSDAKGDDGKPLSIVENFENKALMHSNEHYRIAGFWDINWLSQAKKGLEKFLVNGKMNLLIGVPIQNSLKQLIDADKKVKTAGEKLIEHLSSSPELNKWENFKILIWMLQQKKLEVRILIIGHTSTYPRPEHAKIQLYYDQFEQSIGSSGSKNDTNRGNKGGVDFITISKSWSSPEAANQIEAMQKYFDDHWNHTDAVKLEDVHKNPEFKKVLEKLANKESKHLEPYHKWTRSVGRIKKDTKGIVVRMKKSKFKSDFLVGLENVESIDFPDELEMDQIRYVNEFRPEVNILIAAPKNLEDVALEIPSELLAYCHKSDVWNFHSSDGAHICLYDFDFINKIRRFFGFDELKLELEEEESGEEEEEELPEEDDDVEVVWNPKYFKKPKFPLRENCQVAGVKHWLENKGCLLEHATGSGKTLTGQMIASHMFDESDVVFITTPFIDIANQWEEDALSNFRLDKVKVFCLHSKAKTSIDDSLKRGTIGLANKCKILFITVNDTLVDKWNRFQNFNFLSNFSIIFDEAHNWLSEAKMNHIESKIYGYSNSTLSLTAKLYKHDTSTVRQKMLLENEMPNHTFSLFDAIKSTPKILSNYNYIINTIQIDPSMDLKDAMEEFQRKSIEECISNVITNPVMPSVVYTRNTSDIEEKDTDKYQTMQDVDSSSGAEAVARRITDECKKAKKIFHAESYLGKHGTKDKLRKKILYEDGTINCLVAVKCLDEGVDIPRIKRLYFVYAGLADQRQWIQRRGRALRMVRDENGDIIEKDSIAIIHDYYPIPSNDFELSKMNLETSRWMLQHKNRIHELAKNSLNSKASGLHKYLKTLSSME